MNKHKKDLKLKPLEAHMASLCVAMVSGGFGGLLAKLAVLSYNTIHYLNIELGSGTALLNINLIFGLILSMVLGFGSSWVVCEYAFPSAHKWYGHSSLYHRVYDVVGIVGGVLVYWLI